MTLSLKPEIFQAFEVVSGHLLHLQLQIQQLNLNLINIYAPVRDSEMTHFYQKATNYLNTLSHHECLVLGRDCNITLVVEDRIGREWSWATVNVLREIISDYSLVDIWNDQHTQETSAFTIARVEECLITTSKAPGFCGLTVEFYHDSWDVLVPELAMVWDKLKRIQT